MSWLSILPPILAIAVAIWKREVIFALLIAILSAQLILVSGNPIEGFTSTVQRIVNVFSSNYNTRVLLFSLLVGALIQLIKVSGGVSALVNWLIEKRYANNQKKVALLPTIIGSSIFIDTNMSVLTAGLPSQNLFDKFKMSRARLAYIIDSTCAPISVLILINGWGATILGHLNNTSLTNPTTVMYSSIGLNFYAFVTLAIVFYTVFSGRVHGPMRFSESLQENTMQNNLVAATKKRYMLLPLAFMVISIVIFMYLTGDGDLSQGSGSESVLWAIILSIAFIFLLLRFDAKRKTKELIEECFKGLGNLLPLVTLVMLAFALSSAMGDLKTGAFVSQAVGNHLPVWSIPALVFVLSGFIAFTTGTSFGTFGILIPIVIPLAIGLDIPPALLLSAVLGGSVFGDHASPISDTTVISSLAAGCDHLEHVKTQLPYALTAGGISIVLYIIAGLL